jgi:diaminopimelate decarboxylase
MIGTSGDGLTVGEAAATAIASRFGTPLFVYDADLVRSNYCRFRNAISYAPSRVHYAAVCNPNLPVLRVMKGLGAGLHANTPGDVYCGLRAGFSPDEIVFSGSNLGDDDLDYLLAVGVHINVDSVDDLERACHHGKDREFGLRLHLDGVLPESRMGLRELKVHVAEATARKAGCRTTALHVYCGFAGARVRAA